ncbi:MAG: hypothetical protein K2W99_01510 [Chthoniobacterales bacterium]|nr:hypothetical protein [Chthoniobacterales bacterium]
MIESEISDIFSAAGALITDTHVVYTSGKHGSMYVNKDALYPHTEVISSLCCLLAEHFFQESIDIVVAPALGGIILSQWTAHHLSQLQGKEILAVYAEKSTDGFVIKRGYDQFLPGKKVLILEDVLNTGGSVKKIVELVQTLGAHVMGVGALFNRGNIQSADIGNVPTLFSLITKKMEAWDPAHCPLCAQGIPINTSIGKGAAANLPLGDKLKREKPIS